MAEHKRHRDVPKERFLESQPQLGTDATLGRLLNQQASKGAKAKTSHLAPSSKFTCTRV